MSRPTFISIDLAALSHNFNRVRALAPQSNVMAMVKANGYGHGLTLVAAHLPDAHAFGVASIDEAMQLRSAGIATPIVLMQGLFYADELALAAERDFTVVVHHEACLAMLEEARADLSPMRVWLKINTGMNRLGFRPEQVQSAYQRLSALALVRKPIGLMTHFADADALDLVSARFQVARFREAISGLQAPLSLANSAAIMHMPDTHEHVVRPGLMLYGASPVVGATRVDEHLQPVMTFWSRLMAINDLRPGDKVGYGGTWRAPCAMRVGVVAVGYGDGYPQFAKSGTPVLVNGIRCETVGRVSMDMLTVDLRQCPQAKIDDKVVLWGQGLPVEHVALHNNTSAYELFTRMTGRPRIEVK